MSFCPRNCLGLVQGQAYSINGKPFGVPLHELLEAFLLLLISEGIFEDLPGYQSLNQHPVLANINDNREATGHFVWNAAFDP